MANSDFGPGSILLTRPADLTKPRPFIDRLVHLDVASAYGYGAGGLDYWTRFVNVGEGAITIKLKWRAAASGGETITWDVIEDLEGAEGVYFTTSAKTINLSNGQTEATITITPIDDSEWFFEKWVKIGITGGTGITDTSGIRECALCFYPSVEAPLVSLTTGSTNVSSNGDEASLGYTLSGACKEAVVLRAKVEGALKDHLTVGSATIPAGQTTGTLVLTYDGGGTASEQATVTAWYERSTEDYTENRFDPDAGTYTGPSNKVYVDENQWRSSSALNDVGLQLTTLAGAEPLMPGRPSNVASGSITLVPNKGPYLHFETQDDASPVLDPFFGTPIRAIRNPRTALGDSVNGGNGGGQEFGMAYVRQAFDGQFCGGEESFHSAKNYYLCGYMVDEWATADAARLWHFHRCGPRVRSKDRNHAVIFATDRDLAESGLTLWETRFGDLVPASHRFTVNGVNFWLYDVARAGASTKGTTSSCHPDSMMRNHVDGTGAADPTKGDYGVKVIEGRAFLWMKHFVDPTVTYDHGNDQTGAGDHTKETPGVDDLNAINYPAWLGNDGTNVINLTTFHAERRGVLAHSFYAHSSDSDIAPPDLPWPNLGVMHSPLGHALLDPASGTHTVTAT